MDKAPRHDCWAVLSDRYRRFLDLCIHEGDDPLTMSVQAQLCKPFRDGRFRLLQIGDGCGFDQVYALFPDGREHWIRRVDLKIVEGNIRTVPKRGRIRMGTTSLMGSIAHGIRSGEVFRGR